MTDQQERTLSPPIVPPQMLNAAKTSAQSSRSPLRPRALGRTSNSAESLHLLRHRRSSTLSDSAHSIRSSTDDLLLPRPRSTGLVSSHEPSHWHSVPLALALLPAAGGLFWENGSAVVTDVTLLGLAAVFLNWSLRLPWHWYHSAQEIQARDRDGGQYFPRKENVSETIVEEGSDEEVSQASQPTPPAADGNEEKSVPPERPSRTQSSAATELRVHELLALFACFTGPVIGAWLLHHIRAQLSRPSEGLVSNYNLTIFLLASEFRPLAHLIKLIQARTLHLQRLVATSPYRADTFSTSQKERVRDLSRRLEALESHIADDASNSTSAGKQPDLPTLTRRILQPDLDALNRAVRRYEKRATLLSLQTDSRLLDLESRMSDAITLAAAAERSSQQSAARNRNRGIGVVVTVVVDWIVVGGLFPLRVMLVLLGVGGRGVSVMVGWGEEVVGWIVGRRVKGPVRGMGEVKKGGGGGGGSSGGSGGGVERKRVVRGGIGGKKVM